MTLLLNLIGPHGIHQSSDYRLTDLTTRRPIEDEFGSKQLDYLARTWSAHISFTGFAQIGPRKTRDWILACLGGTADSVDAETALSSLAATAAAELREIPQRNWSLTSIAAIREKDRATRLFVVSCVDRPGQPPLDQPLDNFEIYECSTESPRELVFGCISAVTQADRKFLRNLNRGRADQMEIRRALARINARSASRSNGVVSKACLVTSTMPDGSAAFENFGHIPGLPADLANSPRIVEMITKAQKGQQPTIIQGRGTTGRGVLTTQPMDIAAGHTLLVTTRADSHTLFATDSSGNTFKRVLTPQDAVGVDQDAEWAKLEEGAVAGPARLIIHFHQLIIQLSSTDQTAQNMASWNS